MMSQIMIQNPYMQQRKPREKELIFYPKVTVRH